MRTRPIGRAPASSFRSSGRRSKLARVLVGKPVATLPGHARAQYPAASAPLARLSAAPTRPALSTMVGVIEEGGRLDGPGALAAPPVRPNALGTPGLAAKSSSVLLSTTPVAPATRPRP